MKKVGAILLAAALGVTMTGVMAACGGTGGDTATEKIIKVWLHKSKTEEESRVYATLEELFNDADYKTKDGRDIVMRIEYKGDTIATSIASEITLSGGAGLPDVVAVDAPYVTNYASRGIIVPIDDYLTDEVKGDYVDSVIEQSTYNGKLYALSGADAPAGLFYNKEVLESANIEPGTIENPWSWKDLEKNIETLKAANKAYRIQLSLGFGGDEGLMYLHSPLVYSAGGSFANANGKVKDALLSAKSVAGLEQFADFIRKAQAGSSDDKWSYMGTNEGIFPTGGVAFQIHGPWLINTINKSYKDFKDKYGVMPYPVYEDENGHKGTVATPCGSFGFGVTKATRDADAAAQVVAYLTGAEASELLFDAIGTFPTHKSVFAERNEFGSGALKSLSDLLTQTAKARPKLVNYADLSTAYAKIIDYINNNASESGYDLENKITMEADSVDR